MVGQSVDDLENSIDWVVLSACIRNGLKLAV
jgi:hypothetical protein